VLDTNVISELRGPARADPKVLAWAQATPVHLTFISAITVLALEVGVLLIKRKDGTQGLI
jgi:toxin FitB